MWNRVRYTVWAPFYDTFLRAVAFEEARRRSIARLSLGKGQRVLLVGAGTGQDLDHVPAEVDITAVDVTPAMLLRLEARAARLRRRVTARVADARQLEFADAAFDAVVLHLILAVMPEPERGLREAERVVKPGGRIAVFDKYLVKGEQPSLPRRLANAVARPLFSDLNRRLDSWLAGTTLRVEVEEPVALGGMYRLATLRKPAA
jgi:ubiquinone/menaquinone biosynthesis C-methylase UbiE